MSPIITRTAQLQTGENANDPKAALLSFCVLDTRGLCNQVAAARLSWHRSGMSAMAQHTVCLCRPFCCQTKLSKLGEGTVCTDLGIQGSVLGTT